MVWVSMYRLVSCVFVNSPYVSLVELNVGVGIVSKLRSDSAPVIGDNVEVSHITGGESDIKFETILKPSLSSTRITKGLFSNP